MKHLLFAACAVAAVCATTAQASIIPVLQTITPDGANFTFNYTGTLAADQGVTKGSELVIFDFNGYVPNTIFAPTPDIITAIQMSSPLPLPPGFDDDPNVPNLVFIWNGPDFNTTGAAPADIPFSGLRADSIFGGEHFDAFSALALKNSGDAAGTLTLNQGTVEVPFAARTVPEPAAWSLMILGFGGLGAMLRRRRRSGFAAAA